MTYKKYFFLFLAMFVCVVQAHAQTPDGRSEADLIAALNVPDDSDESVRQFMLAAKQLAVYGTEACVPALAAKLDNPRFAHYARFGLEPNPSKAVDEVFFKSLDTLEDNLLIGVINSIGVRRSPGSLEALKKIKDRKPSDPVIAAGISAAGALGTTDAADALLGIMKTLPPNTSIDISKATGNATFRCAELLFRSGHAEKAIELYDACVIEVMPDYIREAAVYNGILARKADGLGLVVKNLENPDWNIFATSMKAVREIPGDAVGKTLLEKVDALSPERKAMVLEALGDRNEKIVLPVLVKEVDSDHQVIRLAAIRGLRTVGDASSVAVLLNAALDVENSAIAKAAQNTLIWGPNVKAIDDAIVETLKNGKGPARTIAADIIEKRRIVSAFPTLVAMTSDGDFAVRQAATRALAETMELNEFPVLVVMLASAKTAEDTAEVQRAMKSASGRFAQEECVDTIIATYEKAPTNVKTFLLELLAIPRGKKAVEFVASQAWVQNAALKDAATQVLGEWPDIDAADSLLKIAQESRENKYKVRGIRGYVRLARQFGMDEGTRIAMCKTAFETATRDEDKVLIFDVMPRYPSEEMLTLAVSFFDNQKFKDKAYVAAVAVADKIQGKPALAEETMKKVISLTKDNDLKAKAQRILSR